MQILDITSVRRRSRIKWTNVETKNDTDSFLREWSPHLRSCHYFALLEGYQTYLFVGVCGGGWRGGRGGCGYTSVGKLLLKGP